LNLKPAATEAGYRGTMVVSARPPSDARTALAELAATTTDVVYRYRVHPDRAFEFVSPAASRVVGYTPEEHYADPDLGVKLVHPGDRCLLPEMTRQRKDSRGPLVLRWRHKDGRTVWTEQSNTGVYDAHGTLVAIEGTAREIPDPTRPPGETVHLVGDVRLDLSQRRVYVAGRRVELTPSEFRVLWLLTLRPGEVISRAALMQELWQSSHSGGGHTCEVHISSLRRKIEASPRVPERIVTVRGHGYKFVPQDGGAVTWEASVLPFPAWPERLAAVRTHESSAHRGHDVPAAAVFLFDGSLRFTFAGGAALGLHGWKPERIIGRHVRDVLPDSAVPELLPRYESALNGVESSFTHRSADGTRVYATEVMPARDLTGTVTGGVVVARDMTDQVAAEQALVTSEERYRRAFREAGVGMVEATVSGELVDVNTAFCAMLRCSPDDLIGQSFADITHPDDRERDVHGAMELVTRMPAPSEAPAVYRTEKRYLTKDGGTVWAEATARLLRDADGRPQRFVVQSIDISARKRAETLLRWSEHRFRTLAQSAPVGISISKADGRITYANERFCELVGMPFAETTGHGWKAAIHPDDVGRVLGAHERAVSAAGELSIEHRLRTPGGDVRWVHSVSRPLHGSNGEEAARIGTVTDITERVLVGRRFEELFESAPDALVGIVSDGTIVLANQETERLFGYDREELAGRSVDMLLPQRERAGHRRHRREFFKHPKTRPMGARAPFPALRKDGSEVPCEISLASIEAAPGVVAIAAIRDVSDRVRAQRLYRAIAEHFPNGIIVLFDPDLQLLLVRGEGLAALGVDPAEVEGRALADVCDEELLAALDPACRRAAGGVRARVDIEVKGRFLVASAVPLRNGHGEVWAGMLVAEDVTDRRAMEEALRLSEERRDDALATMVRLQEEERAKLASDLHDDTIQALTAALIALDRAARDPLEAERRDALTKARAVLAEATERTRRMTFNLRPQLLDAEGLAGAIPELVDQAATEGEFETATTVAIGRQSDIIESLVYGVIREALSNVRLHARASNVTVTVRETDAVISGEIEDDGEGFDVEAALARARLTHHIGLAMTREKVRLAGGDLTIDSNHGEGTRIQFTLPAA
jgi:PAS domain S-box-containing protein